MNIGTTMKAIKVESLGGPVQPGKIVTTEPVQAPVPVTAQVTERQLVTA